MTCSNDVRKFQQSQAPKPPKVHWVDRFECWLLGHEWPASAVSDDIWRWFPNLRCRRCGVLMSKAHPRVRGER